MSEKQRLIIALAIAVGAVASCSDAGDRPSATQTPTPSAAASVADSSASDSVVASVETQSAPVTLESATTTAPATAAEPTSEEPRYLSGDSDYLFDQQALHTFEIDVEEDALAELDEDPAAEDYVEGNLTFEGEQVGPIGVRYKGSIGSFLGCTDGPNPFDPSGARICTKLSIKLKINWDDSNAEFYGVRKVLLHSQNLDPTLMHERLGYWLFREMGVPAPRSTHARVMINGEYVGVFGLTEEIDGRFTRENFDDGSGNLYKEVWPFDATGNPHSDAYLLAGLETNEDDNPTAAIMTGFANELASASPENALEVIAQWVDVETLLRTFVVDRAIQNNDGPLHWYCFGPCAPHNFYWYEEPTLQQVTLIPWDLDNAFDNLVGGRTGAVTAIADQLGDTSNNCQPFPFGGLNLMQRSAGCDPLIGPVAALDADYDRIRQELLAGPLSQERLAEQLATWSAQIEASVAESAQEHDDAPSVAEWKTAIDQLESALNATRTGTGR